MKNSDKKPGLRMLSDEELTLASGGQNAQGTNKPIRTKSMYCPGCSNNEKDLKDVQILLGGQGRCTNCGHPFNNL